MKNKEDAVPNTDVQSVTLYKSDMELLKNYHESVRDTKKQNKKDDKILRNIGGLVSINIVDDTPPTAKEDYADEVTGTIDNEETYASQLTEQSEAANEQSYYEEEEIGRHF